MHPGNRTAGIVQATHGRQASEGDRHLAAFLVTVPLSGSSMACPLKRLGLAICLESAWTFESAISDVASLLQAQALFFLIVRRKVKKEKKKR